MREETNFFLENQKRIMEQKARLRAEAENKAIVVGADEQTLEPTSRSPRPGEPAQQQKKPFVPDVRPMPQRIVKPKPMKLDEIKAALEETGNHIDATREKFKSDTVSLDAYYGVQKALRLEIVKLQEELREKQDRLHQLETAGTPRDIYAGSILDLERQVMSLAGALLSTLREQAAQRIYGISFEELTPDGQRDAQARYRKVLSRFQSNFYMQLGRTHAQATGEQIDKRASQLLDDIDSLLTTKDFFPQE
jgi:hypothetical protein